MTPALAAQIPVRHLVILMKENRSFDHMLGYLHDRGQPGVEAIPADYANPSPEGPVLPFPARTTCVDHDPDHQLSNIQACVDGGKMDGFVQNAYDTTSSKGRLAVSVNDATDLPFNYWLASTFSIADRNFPSLDSGTFANRNFLLFGSNAGIVNTGSSYAPPTTPSVFKLLLDAGYTWGVYSDGSPLSGTLNWHVGDPGVRPFQSFLDALDAGMLPNVAFVDGIEGVEDDHPTADLQRGEAWLRTIYQHAIASPQWTRLAMVWTYDECGGFFDHVNPGQACGIDGTVSRARGPRVPLVMISPWARRDHVSNVPRDHTSITRLIETLFDLPALTAVDANSDALLDMFDFSCGRDLSVAPAPAAGTGGCV
jgi:phospholipase C